MGAVRLPGVSSRVLKQAWISHSSVASNRTAALRAKATAMKVTSHRSGSFVNQATRRCKSTRGKGGSSNQHHQQQRQQQQQQRRSGIPTYIYAGVLIPAGFCGYIYFHHLDTVPVTGRSRWIATPPDLEIELGDREYQNLLKQYERSILPKHHRASVTVERVGSRIATSALEFAKKHSLKHYINASTPSSPMDGIKQPTFTVVKSDMANAFVLPGNHIFVMTGLFRYARNEDELAAVLAHEMAHTLARHTGERISGGIVRQMLSILSLLVDPQGGLLLVLSQGITLMRELPHSRLQELEADEIGLHIMSHACYDPRAAKTVFARMKHDSSEQPPAFLSTHPSHDQRLQKFDEWMPSILEHGPSQGYCRHIRQQMKEARQRAAMDAMKREASHPRMNES
uniref:Peptidase M48 domain-containing protein n=1 Tax=Craspedostauros australis TaxID=1486917 RepID=A0A7R9WVE8_9STRA